MWYCEVLSSLVWMAHLLCGEVVIFVSMDAIVFKSVTCVCKCSNIALLCVVCRLFSFARPHIPKDHNIDAYSHDQFYTVSLLSCPRAQHLYRVEGLHPQGHDVTAVELRDEINGTYLITYSTSYSFTHLLTHSLTYLITHSLTYLITHSLTYLITYCLTHSLTYLFIHSLTHSLTYLLTQALIYLVTYSFTYSLTHLITHIITYSLTDLITYLVT
jgi:hypothetical protein